MDAINEIKKRINIVDLISNYITLRKRGKSYIGLCPFHNEKTPSFNVNPEKGFYNCFGCHESGDIFSFVQKYENIEFSEALKLLAEKAGVDLPNNHYDGQKKTEKEEMYLANGHTVQFYKNQLKNSFEAMSYLNRRGINQESINMFSLGYAPQGWNELSNYLSEKKISVDISVKAGLLRRSDKNTVYDVFRDRIIYPIFSSMGKPIGFGGRNMGNDQPKYLNTPETFIFNKGKEFYGLNLAKEEISNLDQVIIVEGYMDVIACHTNGIKNAIAVLGTALTKDHIEKITRYTKNIVLCFDADNAGIKAALRSGDLFLEENITPRVAVTPKGEDPDSFLKNHNASDFLNIINNSVGILDFEINVAVQKYNLNNIDEKINALTEACKVVAKEKNAVARDLLISNLIKYHPNPSSAQALDNIRQEVNKYLKKNNKNTENKTNIKFYEDKYSKAQKILLSGLCNGYYDLNILNLLNESHFDIGINRILFNLLYESMINNINISSSYLEDKMRNEQCINEYYSILSIPETEFNHSPEKLADLLIIRKNKSNINRRKELENKLNQGILTQEEQTELLRIIRGK